MLSSADIDLLAGSSPIEGAIVILGGQLLGLERRIKIMIAPKTAEQKIGQVVKAWEDLAPAKAFSGMTLEQFKAKVAPSLAARDSLKTVGSQRVDAQTQRDKSDAESLTLLQLVVSSIKGDPTEGEDSALYQRCGYVRKSERKSGLARKQKTTQPPPANAA